ncbi:hypothetical protein A0H76_1066 [Hepatospora eriocheir]|uniref:t-SNARE coiled-coil homology domain-containing protein n=1 Tax=Hepatospora eriocheir TaxID=1081669 RepID=A0A1X0QHP7_9MICR|nr:hypothetical protein A0H76_1066 [Hepatospora eriocheir]
MGFTFPGWNKVKGWARTNTAEDKEIEQLSNQKAEQNQQSDPSESSNLESSKTEDEYVEGAKQTDKELKGILGNLKSINAETEKQRKLGEEQRTDLQDINRVNEYSKKTQEKTDEKLKKNL